jgi:hypothetical protein
MTFLVSAILILVVIIAFAPKRYLYNLAQQYMAKETIIFSGERIHDRLFGLKIGDANIYVKDILIGHLKELTLRPFIFVNTLTCKEFDSSKEMHQLIPLSLKGILIQHWVGQPYKLFIKAEGSFGEAKGFVNLKDKKIYLEIFSVPEFEKHIKTLAKKSEEGFYVYEQRY